MSGGFVDVWVEGELSNFKTSAAGHLYFSLKDERAQFPAVCFRSTARYLRFQPQNGKLFRVRGRISTYESRGEYQIVAQVLEPAGLGALQLAFEQLKEGLEREGLFRRERKRPIPQVPARIGIVTSTKSAALADVLSVLKRRHNAVDVLIYPVEVQGDGASIQIMEGIDYLSRETDVDVIIVTRGGGSLEDLWPFNEERVARAVARSRTPVVSAVGHEVDYTICDFVADVRVPTPSAAAEIVVRSKAELSERLNEIDRRLNGAVRHRLTTLRHFLESRTGSRGFLDARNRIGTMAQRVDDLAFRLERCGRAGGLARLRSHQLERVRQDLARVVRLRIHGWRQALSAVAHKLDALSPLAVLERGYAICLNDDGVVLRSAGTVDADARIKILLHRGSLIARVLSRKPERDPGGTGPDSA